MITIGNHDGRLEGIRYDGSIVKRDRSRRIARHMMLQHRVRIQSSREFDPTWVHWFRKKSQGRRCSCWSIEDSPDGGCEVCFGEGIVGAYEKYGYETAYVDVTYPSVQCVNTIPYPESGHRPIPFALAPGMKRGYVQMAVNLRGSKGLDTFSFAARQSASASVSAWIKASNDPDFVRLNRVNLEARLLAVGTTLTFRFELERVQTGPDADMPLFSHMMIRHQVSDRILIPIDIPRQNENLQLQELGVIEVLSTLRGWATWEWGEFRPEDFFVTVGTLPESAIRMLAKHMAAVKTKHQYEMSDRPDQPVDFQSRLGALNGLLKTDRVSARLKVISTEPNEAIGVLTSYDLDLRHVQGYEAISKVPV